MAKPENVENKKNKKERKARAPEQATFPTEGFVNAYGFIRLNGKVAEAFGVEKGKKTNVTIDMNDGALIIRKA